MNLPASLSQSIVRHSVDLRRWPPSGTCHVYDLVHRYDLQHFSRTKQLAVHGQADDYSAMDDASLVRRVFFWGDHGSRQSTASAEDSFHSGPMCNPVCTKCLYAWVVLGYCCSDSAYVCESFAMYIFSAQPQLLVSLDARPLHATPDRHWATQAHPSSQRDHSGLVLWWPNVVHMA